MDYSLRAYTNFQTMRQAFLFLPLLQGKVRIEGCHGLSTAAGPLSLSLSHTGRGNP
jgi:hypothetical protein